MGPLIYHSCIYIYIYIYITWQLAHFGEGEEGEEGEGEERGNLMMVGACLPALVLTTPFTHFLPALTHTCLPAHTVHFSY